MGLLKHEERQTLIRLLLKLPYKDQPSVIRKALLAGLPEDLQNSIGVMYDSLKANITLIVNGVDDEAVDEPYNGIWPVIGVINNAIWWLERNDLPVDMELKKLRTTLNDRATQRAFSNFLSPSGSSSNPPSGLIRDPTASNHAHTATMRVIGSQGSNFYRGLLQAFPSKSKLDQMLYFHLGERPDGVIEGDSLEDIVFNLLMWAVDQRKIADLLIAALTENPGNSYLRSLSEQVGFVPTSPALKEFERVMQNTTNFLSVNANYFEAWYVGMRASEVTVCRVESPAHVGVGTGFLLGPDLVLTCHHVIEPVINKHIGSEEVVLRFDFKTLADGTTLSGQAYRLAKNWLIDYSSGNMLDYALLQVMGSPGDDRIEGLPGAPPRRWLIPSTSHVFQADEPLFIIQHPRAAPLMIAFEKKAIIAVNPEQTRVTYRVSTEAGSSGAPCFTIDWKLVAMHQGRDSKSRAHDRNMGIPISAILEHLKQKNFHFY